MVIFCSQTRKQFFHSHSKKRKRSLLRGVFSGSYNPHHRISLEYALIMCIHIVYSYGLLDKIYAIKMEVDGTWPERLPP